MDSVTEILAGAGGQSRDATMERLLPLVYDQLRGLARAQLRHERPDHTLQPTAPESAPTEVLLGRAAAELFQQLPTDQRARLGDVQEVIRSLERAASALRVRRDTLQQGLAETGAPDASPRRARLVAELEAARTAVEKRLGVAVAALENLRLDLLRLRAGVGNADDLTASIAEARSVGEAVDVELAARLEAESLTH